MGRVSSALSPAFALTLGAGIFACATAIEDAATSDEYPVPDRAEDAAVDSFTNHNSSPPDASVSTVPDASDANAADARDALVEAKSVLPIPRNQLVGEWLFDGNANDTSGNTNHGAVTGALPIADRHGKPNAAYAFNGTSDHIEVPTSTSLGVSASYSVSAWIKTDAFVGLSGIVSKYRTPSADGLTLRLAYDAPFDGIDINEGSSSVDGGVTGTIVKQKWQHVVAVVQVRTVDVYIDGAAAYHGIAGYDTVPNADSLGIGSDYDGRYFKGAIDDVRIYGRGLTLPEIRALFEAN